MRYGADRIKSEVLLNRALIWIVMARLCLDNKLLTGLFVLLAAYEIWRSIKAVNE